MTRLRRVCNQYVAARRLRFPSRVRKTSPALFLILLLVSVETSAFSAPLLLALSSHEARQVFEVGWVDKIDSIPLTLEHYNGLRPIPGARYLVLDEKGLLGELVATGRQVTVECYDNCPDVRELATWLKRPRRLTKGKRIAIGPMELQREWPLARLSLTRITKPPSREAWTTWATIDLDGDGVSELELCFRLSAPGRTFIHQTRRRHLQGWEILGEYLYRDVLDNRTGD